MVKLEDFTKELNIADGAKAIAFDCINTISDIYGDDPIIANAMIKGVRYYLGYLVQAGGFAKIDDKNDKEENNNEKTPKFEVGQCIHIDCVELRGSKMKSYDVCDYYDILEIDMTKDKIYYKIQQNFGTRTGDKFLVEESTLENCGKIYP